MLGDCSNCWGGQVTGLLEVEGGGLTVLLTPPSSYPPTSCPPEPELTDWDWSIWSDPLIHWFTQIHCSLLQLGWGWYLVIGSCWYTYQVINICNTVIIIFHTVIDDIVIIIHDVIDITVIIIHDISGVLPLVPCEMDGSPWPQDCTRPPPGQLRVTRYHSLHAWSINISYSSPISLKHFPFLWFYWTIPVILLPPGLHLITCQNEKY